ncbi:hypothetical protein E1293_17815 [Actinomadura darangshiensis]|uniref:Uncharacterized protein n=1 Tax=Actinomadura darangshiensis TaxID=705336 RepID=A0A4R5B8S0_9ACTN|nr:hypothetical protein [Actinomadura darangshiensis]TDD81855.1 hypothetical protein E1293_17815 [Actinomadura darangshiensis]
MPDCNRLSCFHVRLEAGDDRTDTDADTDADTGADSCGAHLAEVVQKSARRAREQRRRPAQVVVYAAAGGRQVHPGGFGRLPLGAIPV